MIKTCKCFKKYIHFDNNNEIIGEIRTQTFEVFVSILKIAFSQNDS